MTETVSIREVGLRDGLQMVPDFLATEHKIDWIRSEAVAGVAEIEVTSFLPPKVIAQFSDAAEVARQARDIPDLLASALVPNLRGAQTGFDLNVAKINFVLSASEAHNQSNVRRSTQQSLEEFRKVLQERHAREKNDSVVISGYVATSFGCSIQGEVDGGTVVDLARDMAQAGADEIVLADTVGYGNPAQVRRIFAAVQAEIGQVPLAAHFHDTRGLGLANVVAALDIGVRRFDASLGGLGGCPFAPGATGNINIEDCAFLLEAMGMSTGIDLEHLFELRARVQEWLPSEILTGATARAGLPKNFGSER